jgi:pyruvate,water dikinase
MTLAYARPMAHFGTEWDTAPNPAYDIWTSVNGSEVVPGVLSPLVASAFNRYDHLGLRRLMAEYPGGQRAELYEAPVGNFFGVFGGRLALNNGFAVAATSALDAVIAQAILQQFFTGAEGGDRFLLDSTEEEREAAYAVARHQRDDAPRFLDEHRDRLYAERASDRYERDLRLPLEAALERFLELFEDSHTVLLNRHYVVSVAAGEWQVRLAMLLGGAGIDPAAVVGLCSGLGEVESSKPAIHLYELAQLARSHPEVADALRAGDAQAVVEAASARRGPAWAAFGERLDRFLFEYGYRVQGEADPTNADWSEDPTFALSQVRSMLDVPDEDSPSANVQRAVAARCELEAAVRAQVPDEQRLTFDEVLANAQHFTRLRERSKSIWVLATRRTRAPYLALARRLVERGVIDEPDDARYLVLAELEQVVRGGDANGSGDPGELRERIARRRAQAAEAEGWLLPDNWIGEPDLRRRGDADFDAGVLQGMGVSVGAGPVTGTARIIPSAEAGLARDIAVGEVLVAPFTDAPWTPLFIAAGAVVVETGGVLSHAATVAREFGIPAVVMCKDATEIIGDGDTVTVDGAAGTVTILARAS